MSAPIVIVGAGHAGGQVAITLRGEGYDGPLLIIGDERWPPYERPPLSKALLAGELEVERTFLRQPAFYAERRIELQLERGVVAVDRAGKRLLLRDGTAQAYAKLVLATGSRARRLPLPGADLPGVRYLRGIDDSLALRDDLQPGIRLVVVGGGYIGLEVAATAVKRGCRVTLLEALPRLLARVTSPIIAAFFAALHRDRGVDLRLGQAITEIFGVERAAGVRLGDGTRLAADLVVVGIGGIANDELARAAGLEIGNGIVVDEFAQTGDPNITAAGDVTFQPNGQLGQRVRLESVGNAMAQAQVAARTALGNRGKPHDEVPWFWSDQFEVKFQIAGLVLPGDETILRGRPEDGKFAVLYLRKGRLAAVDAINTAKDYMIGRRLIGRNARFDRALAADLATPLADAVLEG